MIDGSSLRTFGAILVEQGTQMQTEIFFPVFCSMSSFQKTIFQCIRSSDGKRTASRSLCEVKPHSAESVLARGTSMERSVMNTFLHFFFCSHVIFIYHAWF